jgi:hypothetical protein
VRFDILPIQEGHSGQTESKTVFGQEASNVKKFDCDTDNGRISSWARLRRVQKYAERPPHPEGMVS